MGGRGVGGRQVRAAELKVALREQRARRHLTVRERGVREHRTRASPPDAVVLPTPRVVGVVSAIDDRLRVDHTRCPLDDISRRVLALVRDRPHHQLRARQAQPVQVIERRQRSIHRRGPVRRGPELAGVRRHGTNTLAEDPSTASDLERRALLHGCWSNSIGGLLAVHHGRIRRVPRRRIGRRRLADDANAGLRSP